MITFLLNSCTITSLLFIWFNTDAFIEYLSLFKLEFLVKNYTNNPNGLTFTQYLFLSRKDYKSRIIKFLLKLICCPVCLGFVLSIIINFNCYIFPCYITTLLLYFTLLRLKD